MHCRIVDRCDDYRVRVCCVSVVATAAVTLNAFAERRIECAHCGIAFLSQTATARRSAPTQLPVWMLYTCRVHFRYPGSMQMIDFEGTHGRKHLRSLSDRPIAKRHQVSLTGCQSSGRLSP